MNEAAPSFCLTGAISLRQLIESKGDCMSEHQQTFIKIKSDLLDICVESIDHQCNYNTKLIEKCLFKHFNFNKMCLLLFEKELLKPCQIDYSKQLQHKGIQWSMVKHSFTSDILTSIPPTLQHMEDFSTMSHMLLLKTEEGVKAGTIIFQETEQWNSFASSKYFKEFVNILSKTISMMNKQFEVRLNENQYRKLYNMTDLFHSTMDIDVILQNVLMTIQENFPEFNANLILSNDYDRQTTVNIKPFDYISERQSAIEAFVSGTITFENADDLNASLLNAPIKGSQAIYGVLQVCGPIQYNYSPMQIDFIKMLAHASGNALENAKLYHQSHRLISDLQLINETTHRLNMRLNIDEMITFLQKQLMKSFKPMEIGFVFKDKSEFVLSNVVTDFFNTVDSSNYIEHVAKHFKNSQEPLFIADFSRITSKNVQFKSMMAIPMIVEQRIYGFSIVLHEEPYFFSFDSFKLMQSLIQHSSLAIANSILRNKLQVMVDHDHLTKLHARSFLDKFVARSLKNDSGGMFLLIDIDNFKQVNDTYGHQVGDKVLVQIANELQRIVGTRGICARWGGEEMSIYVPNMHDDESIALTDTIVKQLPKVTNPQVTVSAGLVMWDQSNRPEYQSIFLKADTALYHAKNNGKNQVCIYNEHMSMQS